VLNRDSFPSKRTRGSVVAWVYLDHFLNEAQLEKSRASGWRPAVPRTLVPRTRGRGLFAPHSAHMSGMASAFGLDSLVPLTAARRSTRSESSSSTTPAHTHSANLLTACAAGSACHPSSLARDGARISPSPSPPTG
jgi:hypothetical protein